MHKRCSYAESAHISEELLHFMVISSDEFYEMVKTKIVNKASRAYLQRQEAGFPTRRLTLLNEFFVQYLVFLRELEAEKFSSKQTVSSSSFICLLLLHHSTMSGRSEVVAIVDGNI